MKKRKRRYMSNGRACLIIADWAAQNDRENYERYRVVASHINMWYMIYIPTGKQIGDPKMRWRTWLRKNHPDMYKIVWPNE